MHNGLAESSLEIIISCLQLEGLFNNKMGAAVNELQARK